MKTYLIFGVIVAMMFAYIMYLRSDIKVLEENAVKYEQALKNNEKYIANLKLEFDEVKSARDSIQEVIYDKDQQIIKLQKSLTRLEDLASKKPTLVQKRVNLGTNKLFKDIEEISK